MRRAARLRTAFEKALGSPQATGGRRNDAGTHGMLHFVVEPSSPGARVLLSESGGDLGVQVRRPRLSCDRAAMRRRVSEAQIALVTRGESQGPWSRMKAGYSDELKNGGRWTRVAFVELK